jgi:hypothetical protein
MGRVLRPARRRLLQALAAAGASSWTVARAETDPLDSFLGRFRHSGGDSDRKARDKAIDDVVAGMSILVRGIARDRLKEANPIAAKLAFSTTDKDLTVAMDARSYTGPRDGGKVKVKGITGDEMEMHYAIATARIEQVFAAGEKGRTNRFSLDGDTVAMRVRVHATQLPKDLVYTLTYTRAT